ncbi:MAG TPA: DUF192 domain-containing protein [Holophagaceae bacterium]|nr:DUF192 domain-containing protein [Holophagaceae bacterium]
MKGSRFTAEVAATQAEKAKGLMERAHLPQDRCMVFLYDQDDYHPIWMKNCLIALDVAWLDAQGRVLEFLEKVPPCSPMLGNDCPTYGGTVPGRYFVEFPVGTFKRLGLKKGDLMAWELKLDDGRVVKLGTLPAAAPAKAHKK